MAADPGTARHADEPADVSLIDRVRAVEDELRTPWTILSAALEDLAGTIVDVDGRRAIEAARRSAERLRSVGEAFLNGQSLRAGEPGALVPIDVPHAPAAQAPLHLLIADDNADLCAYLATMLGAKYAVDTVRDGAALVAAARTHQPDVIVTDAQMPFVDGFEAARMLREDARTAEIPIVMLSGNAGDETAEAARNAGVDDYLVKPFSVAELIARVDALVRRRSAFAETSDAHATADVRTWRLLAATAERFVGIMKPGRALDALGDIIVPAIGDWYFAYLLDGDAIQLKSVVHRQPAKRDFAWMLEREYPHVAGSGSPLARTIASGVATLIADVTPEVIAAMSRDAHHAAILSALQFSSAALVPLRTSGNAVRGAIVVLGAETRPHILASDLDLLQRIVDRAAGAYEAAARPQREPNVASGLQRALLPGSLPAVEGLTLSVAYAPAAREAHVGGSWYDAMALADGRVLLSVGDIAGHGLAVSVAMSQMRLAIRRFAQTDPRPSSILAQANALMLRDGRIATALVAILEPLSLDVTIASAGRLAPAILDSHGTSSHLTLSGPMLGVDANAAFDDLELRLQPGSTMLLYTGGLIAGASGSTEPAALDRLGTALERCAASGEDLAGAVYRDLLGDAAPEDDVALLAATASATLDRLDLTFPAQPKNAVRARTAISRFLIGAGMADRAGDLLVAAGEAIGNAIEHAYRGQPGALRVRGRRNGDAVTVEIRDFGQWHSDTASEGRGFGLPLMRAFSDGVDVERTPFGTRVELLARHAPSGAEALDPAIEERA